MIQSQETLFEDGRFTVTGSDIRTPSAYYPVADTVGRIRGDLQYAAIGYALLIGSGLVLYFDLWRWIEILLMGGSIILALMIGAYWRILMLQARGFPVRLFIGRRESIEAVFEAITKARAQSQQQGGWGAAGGDEVSTGEASDA